MGGDSDSELLRLVSLEMFEEGVGDGVDCERSGVQGDCVVDGGELGNW